MSYIITCYTLFDITQTGVLNRSRPNNTDEDWITKRNTQANLDTIMQTISLRSQPEMIKPPEERLSDLYNSKFGFLYKQMLNRGMLIFTWRFDFIVQHPSVFINEFDSLGKLLSDCDGVPMINCGHTFSKVSNFLDTTPELCNIYFENHEPTR